MRVAFDSRPLTHARGHGCDSAGAPGRDSGELLAALRETAGPDDEIREGHRPWGADVFHAPRMEGAMLHCPCPMVVTLHDLVALRRPSERLRAGGIHLRLRHLAVQRATHVIVPCESVAREVAAELGFERERVVVIPEGLTREETARATWEVYRRALAQPHRPCVTVPRRRRSVGAAA